MPAISICLPVYNGETFLRKTIDSILAQTYRDFELIIVDNASTDSTPDIIKSYKDPRIRYIRNEKNIGVAQNWNRCVELASCPLIALFHADDIYRNDIIEKEAALLESHPNVGAVFSEAVRIDPDDRALGRVRIPGGLRGKAVFTLADILRQLVRNNKNPLVCPTCMARKEIYRKAGPFDHKSYRYVFDIDMYLRMAELADLAIIEEPLISYRIHPSQGTTGYATETVDHNEVYDMYDRYIGKHGDALSKPDLRRYECFKRWDHTSYAIRALQHGDTAKAKRLLKDSISRESLMTSLTDINLLMRLLISAAFKALVFVGIGVPAARMLYGRRVGYL